MTPSTLASRFGPEKPERIHLFRSAPSVRSWSKYQEIAKRWTLCGVDRGVAPAAWKTTARCTEEASLVTCPYCRELMRPSAPRKVRVA
jgi:hypothetical protein